MVVLQIKIGICVDMLSKPNALGSLWKCIGIDETPRYAKVKGLLDVPLVTDIASVPELLVEMIKDSFPQEILVVAIFFPEKIGKPAWEQLNSIVSPVLFSWQSGLAR
jgi:hypothetical protein